MYAVLAPNMLDFQILSPFVKTDFITNLEEIDLTETFSHLVFIYSIWEQLGE